jgi:hypothetical protein
MSFLLLNHLPFECRWTTMMHTTRICIYTGQESAYACALGVLGERVDTLATCDFRTIPAHSSTVEHRCYQCERAIAHSARAALIDHTIS